MIAAVTGGTGFVGRALVARLRRDAAVREVRVLSRRGGFDLTRPLPPQALDGVDVLFHCAGETRDEAAMRALHVEGTRRLVEAARGRVARWVQLSSVGVYGRRLREGALDESAPPAPEGEYEVTKAESDRLLGGAGLEHAILRPSIVFGPGMPNPSLYQLVAAVDRGRFAYIGPAGAVATYVCVEDVADALALLGSAPGAAGVYNLSDDRPLESFVAAIAGALGRAARFPRLPEPLARLLARIPGLPLTPGRVDALTRRVRYPSARMRDELGFRFGVSIEAGLRALVADWRRQDWRRRA
jgi:nucleoside-diphosphate-sugar epimerase